MKKALTIMGGIVVLVVILILIVGCSTDDTPANADAEYYSPDPITVENNNEGSINIASSLEFGIYKGKQAITFEELDEVEQYAVSFIKEFYNVDKSETEDNLISRIHFYMQSETMYTTLVNSEALIDFSQRELTAVYMLPEYHEMKTGYIVPMVVQYLEGNEEVEDVLHLGVSIHPDWNIMGSRNGYEWFVVEMTRKYGLDLD